VSFFLAVDDGAGEWRQHQRDMTAAASMRLTKSLSASSAASEAVQSLANWSVPAAILANVPRHRASSVLSGAAPWIEPSAANPDAPSRAPNPTRSTSCVLCGENNFT
jgi:hypothetical protein